MRRTAVFITLAAVAGLSLVAVSAAMSGDKSTTRDAPILGVAVAGTFVAAALDQGKTECFHAELWNAVSNKVTHFGKKVTCQAPGGIRGPSVIANRAVWATNVGGNLRDWTVWTATTTAPVPKALATVQGADASGPDPVTIGRSGAGIVAYAVGTKITALRANGSTAWVQTAQAPVRLLATGDTPGKPGVTLAISRDDSVIVVDAAGNIITKGTGAGVTDECLLGEGVVGQTDGFIINTSTNPPTKFPVPKQAKLLDCAAGIVIYRVGSSIRGIRLATGKTAKLVTGPKKGLIVAAISPKGLAWAIGPTLHWRPAATAFAPLG
jgi:hypothetical protein